MPAEPLPVVRLVSWNVRDLLGDSVAVARVLRDLRPDVACLQEAPRRPGGGLRIARAARAARLRHVAGGRTSGGTALLLGPAVGLRWSRAFRLPVEGPLTRTRGAVVAELAVRDGGTFSLACVHLPLEPALRVRHVQLTAAVLAGASDPHVVAGDLNEPPGSPAWRAWEPLAADPAPGAGVTFPAGRADKRLDAVLVGPGVDVLEYGDGGADPELVAFASDHVPVLALLALPRRPGPDRTTASTSA